MIVVRVYTRVAGVDQRIALTDDAEVVLGRDVGNNILAVLEKGERLDHIAMKVHIVIARTRMHSLIVLVFDGRVPRMVRMVPVGLVIEMVSCWWLI